MTAALADTQALLWWLAGDPRLSEPARAAIVAGGEEIFYSAASIWEAAIKSALGKLAVEGDLMEALEADGFTELPIRARHAARAGALPAHHRDPFDRMLVAQAQQEDLAIITADPGIARYDVRIVW